MSTTGPVVLDRDGRPGTLVDTEGADGTATVRLPSGARLRVPAGLVHRDPGGTYRLDLSFSDVEASGAEGAEVIPEIEEHIRTATRVRDTGRVRVSTRTETTDATVDEPTWRETVTVERVPKDEPAESARAPWQDGDATVIPVYEEVLVVEKRLVLREEVRVTRRREAGRHTETVSLRAQHVDVERLPPGPDA